MSIASPAQLETWLNQSLFAQRSCVAAELENHHRHLTASVMQMLHGKTWAVQLPPGGAGVAVFPTQPLPPQIPPDISRIETPAEASAAPAPPPPVKKEPTPYQINPPPRAAPVEDKPEANDAQIEPAAKEEEKPKLRKMGTAALDHLNLTKPPKTAAEAVHHPAFELFFISLICLNAIIMALAAQYSGIQLGYEMQYPGSEGSGETTWPHAGNIFAGLSSFFGAAFTIELLVKIAALKTHFVKSGWNWLDLVVVLVWISDSSGGVSLKTVVNPTIFRLLRLARLLRLIEVVQFGTSFQSLAVLVTSIKGCGPILGWSMLLLCTVMVICSMILNYLLIEYMDDETGDIGDRQMVYKFFGTFTRSMLSMFEITLGNWVPITRMLVEEVSEFFSLFFIMYKVTVGFAIMKVITGVFMQATFKCAATNDDLMVMERQRQVRVMSQKMEKLFKESDTSGDGNLSIEEFKGVVEDPRIKSWLSAMELDVRDPELFFDLIDKTGDNDAEISGKELAVGVSRLKGAARSIDMHLLIRVVENMNKLMIQRREEIDDGPKAGEGGGVNTKHASISQRNSDTLNVVSAHVEALQSSLSGLESLMAELVRGMPQGKRPRSSSPEGADFRTRSISRAAPAMLENGESDLALPETSWQKQRSNDADDRRPPSGGVDANGNWVKSWMEAAKSSRGVVATGRSSSRDLEREKWSSSDRSGRSTKPLVNGYSAAGSARAAPQNFEFAPSNTLDAQAPQRGEAPRSERVERSGQRSGR